LCKKEAIINMENKGDECFKWCVARAMYPTERNQQRMDKTLREKIRRIEMGWNDISYPVEGYRQI